jgi:hypothetical protein
MFATGVQWQRPLLLANRQLFGTAEVRDALVAAGPRATTAEATYAWCAAINNLAVNDVNKQLFGTAEVRDALVAVLPHATTADACQWWCIAISNLNHLDVNKQLFGTAAVHDALVARFLVVAFRSS